MRGALEGGGVRQAAYCDAPRSGGGRVGVPRRRGATGVFSPTREVELPRKEGDELLRGVKRAYIH